MSRFKLIVAYDGTHYHGFAKQPNGITIQELLEKAAEAILNQPIHVIGAGRTDTGVHAKAQCCVFDATTEIMPERLVKAINSKLPRDVVVQSIELVSEAFHPRYAAKRKTYRYQIHNGKVQDPFIYRYAYFYPYKLDLRKMQEAATHIVGKHDFAAFCSAGSSVKTTIREVYRLEITKQGELIQIDICGNGFLYNMVRIIVGTLIEVGIGRKAPDSLVTIIESKNRKLASPTAPPQGLMMLNIEYGEEA
ncbi:tRNA pseudouridine(38-40) synthase TruA [Sporanaerobium hydrogeniformans]|uniref:tRNA pseudouridine(38-40) synthase TruA n=1 Tax=Sporanaerobium hydrogeniformans TaxID=3072179 RepID=A0AC61DDC0_9FIRM|nr:tRNA pseudouridine(38-40) synthase TruA [Sporanaerobium hydrogeniformans]PHV71299.1 tRNA pseudouridine(38-40) synthase TruA [Sporanaerobium hydrogeniformans]